MYQIFVILVVLFIVSCAGSSSKTPQKQALFSPLIINNNCAKPLWGYKESENFEFWFTSNCNTLEVKLFNLTKNEYQCQIYYAEESRKVFLTSADVAVANFNISVSKDSLGYGCNSYNTAPIRVAIDMMERYLNGALQFKYFNDSGLPQTCDFYNSAGNIIAYDVVIESYNWSVWLDKPEHLNIDIIKCM